MIRCIAIDDEPLALRQIERNVERIPGVELAGSFYRAEDARAFLQSEEGSIDVILLDIEMPDCSGVEFARRLGENAPYVIFTTAYPQYAVEGFRLDAVDYLLKPLSFEEMTEAFEKVRRRLVVSSGGRSAEISVKSSGIMRRLAVRDILYVKGYGEYVQIFLRGEAAPLVVFDSMKRLEGELEEHGFMRVHKSYLINLEEVTGASRTSALIGNESIPVGEKYRPAYQAFLATRF